MRSSIISVGLILGALPITHLLDLGYSFLSFEVWATSFLFLCIGTLLAALCARLGLLFVLATLTLYAFVSVYLVNTSDFSPLILTSILVLSAMVMRRTESSTLPVIATFAVIFSLSNVVVPKNTGVSHSTDLNKQAVQNGGPKNAILHIILDEQAHLAKEAKSTYSQKVAAGILHAIQNRGFQVHPKVRAVHHDTYSSLSNLMSLSGDENNYLVNDPGETHIISVRNNMLFARLRDEGYRLRVYQSDYMDFCANNQSIACSTYPTRDMSVFEASGLSYTDRVHIALLAISRDYMNRESGRFIGAYRAVAYWIAPPKKSYRYLSWPGKSLEIMELLRADLETLAPGDAYFAHLLVPHFPFIYEPDCRLKRPEDWAYPIRQGNQQSYASVKRAYWDQTDCTHSKIMQILDLVIDKPYVTIIIHGDHGARLLFDTDRENESDNLDTYFAVRNSEYNPAAAPSNSVLQKVFNNAIHSFIARDQGVSITVKHR